MENPENGSSKDQKYQTYFLQIKSWINKESHKYTSISISNVIQLYRLNAFQKQKMTMSVC